MEWPWLSPHSIVRNVTADTSLMWDEEIAGITQSCQVLLNSWLLSKYRRRKIFIKMRSNEKTFELCVVMGPITWGEWFEWVDNWYRNPPSQHPLDITSYNPFRPQTQANTQTDGSQTGMCAVMSQPPPGESNTSTLDFMDDFKFCPCSKMKTFIIFSSGAPHSAYKCGYWLGPDYRRQEG